MRGSNRVILLKSDGTVRETHTVAVTDCPFQYAAKIANRLERREEFSCQVEIFGERLGPFDADETVARAFLKEMFDAEGT